MRSFRRRKAPVHEPTPELFGNTFISFNGTAAQFDVISSTYMTAIVPNGAGFATVTTANGNLQSNQKFRVRFSNDWTALQTKTSRHGDVSGHELVDVHSSDGNQGMLNITASSRGR